MMNPTKDYFYNVEQLKVELYRFQTDGLGSKKLNDLAAWMGYSPKAFLNAQMRLFNLPNINSEEAKANLFETPTSINGVNNGFKYLVSEAGLPWRGAAYLAANINALNGWDLNLEDSGQFCPIFAPWMQTGARLAKMQDHFNKTIDQITYREQINYMLIEMKNDYPDIYRVLNNPRATHSELTRAIYEYFGSKPALGQELDMDQWMELNGQIIKLLGTIPE
jgi:hypothetical protein